MTCRTADGKYLFSCQLTFFHSRKGTGQPHIKLVNIAHFVVRWDTFEAGRMGNLRAATMGVTTHSVVGLGSLPNQLNGFPRIVRALVCRRRGVIADAPQQSVEMQLVLTPERTAELRPSRLNLTNLLAIKYPMHVEEYNHLSHDRSPAPVRRK